MIAVALRRQPLARSLGRANCHELADPTRLWQGRGRAYRRSEYRKRRLAAATPIGITPGGIGGQTATRLREPDTSDRDRAGPTGQNLNGSVDLKGHWLWCTTGYVEPPATPIGCARIHVMAPRLRDRGSVLKACAEYDRLGQQRFLDTYGFGAATRYLLRVGDELYDSKAIVGVAYSYEHPDEGVLGCHEFSGGVSGGAAAWQLERLGFEIVTRP